jgi:hypothetical protein
VRAAWRDAEELQLSVPLALEALLIRLRRELAGPRSLVHEPRRTFSSVPVSL